MNILCCLVHPEGTYLNKPVCSEHLSLLGLKVEYVQVYYSTYRKRLCEWQGSKQITQSRAKWLEAHQRIE